MDDNSATFKRGQNLRRMAKVDGDNLKFGVGISGSDVPQTLRLGGVAHHDAQICLAVFQKAFDDDFAKKSTCSGNENFHAAPPLVGYT